MSIRWNAIRLQNLVREMTCNNIIRTDFDLPVCFMVDDDCRSSALNIYYTIKKSVFEATLFCLKEDPT